VARPDARARNYGGSVTVVQIALAERVGRLIV
jgi:hypothetical protein